MPRWNSAPSGETRSSKDAKIMQVQFMGFHSDRLWIATVGAVAYREAGLASTIANCRYWLDSLKGLKD